MVAMEKKEATAATLKATATEVTEATEVKEDSVASSILGMRMQELQHQMSLTQQISLSAGMTVAARVVEATIGQQSMSPIALAS
jgi:hypothetical protein